MKFVKTMTLILFVTGLLVLFQNCNVAQNTGILGSKSTPQAMADKVAEAAPFAFDLVADTISYNSCVGENLNNSDIFGLKIGANEGFIDTSGTGALKAGLKIRPEFLDYVGKNIKPRYPSTVITPGQIQSLLSNSPANKDTYVQIAVRKKLDLSVVVDVIQNINSAVTLPRDGIVFTQAPLTLDPAMTRLTKNIQFGESGTVLSEGAWVTNLNSDDLPSPIEHNFGFSNIIDETFPRPAAAPGDTENLGYGERYSEQVRNYFNGTSGVSNKRFLAVTFGTSASAAGASGNDLGLSLPKRKDATKKGQAYGRGYNLQFGYPADTVAQGWKNNVLKQVTEVNLDDGTPVGGVSWNCESYIIVKQTQFNNGIFTQPSCSGLTSTDMLDSNLSKRVKKIRRHYLESAWNIGLFYYENELIGERPRLVHKICLAPKNPGNECYLPTNTVIPGSDVGVNYKYTTEYKPDPTMKYSTPTECYLYNTYGTSYIGSIDAIKANGRCAQFASICIR